MSDAEDLINSGFDPVVKPNGSYWKGGMNPVYNYGSARKSNYAKTNIYSYSNNKESAKRNGHTYEVWQRLGYQVKKGEKAAYKHYGNYVFTRDQVV